MPFEPAGGHCDVGRVFEADRHRVIVLPMQCMEGGGAVLRQRRFPQAPDFLSRKAAIQALHFPGELDEIEQARRRLA